MWIQLQYYHTKAAEPQPVKVRLDNSLTSPQSSQLHPRPLTGYETLEDHLAQLETQYAADCARSPTPNGVLHNNPTTPSHPFPTETIL